MLNQDLVNTLHKIVGTQCVLTDEADCWPYGYDNSRQHALPDAVVFVTTHRQIVDIVRLCNQHLIPLTPRGRGTGTTGGTVPLHGGIVLSLERMDRIVEIDPANRIMKVQPGVTNQGVQEAASSHGFFWAPDPTSASYCTVGGNLAFNSAGPRAVKYGTARENTLALTAITGAGQEIETGVMTTKGVVGFDLTRLLIGSEGTLAIITEAVLKLIPISESKRTIQAIYTTVENAARAVASIMAQPITPYALEFMDHQAINMIRAHANAALPDNAGAILMIEIDGSEACMETGIRAIARAARVAGCLHIEAARTNEEIQDLWATRKALAPALRNVAPHRINEDVVVPISHLAELIQGLQGLGNKHEIAIVNFGHAGNGNIHVNLLVDPDDKRQMAAAVQCLDEVFSLVLSLKGSLSGEHGVGITKRDYIDREIDSATLELMRRIKRQFDPKGILNPAKALPLET